MLVALALPRHLRTIHCGMRAYIHGYASRFGRRSWSPQGVVGLLVPTQSYTVHGTEIRGGSQDLRPGTESRGIPECRNARLISVFLVLGTSLHGLHVGTWEHTLLRR